MNKFIEKWIISLISGLLHFFTRNKGNVAVLMADV